MIGSSIMHQQVSVMKLAPNSSSVAINRADDARSCISRLLVMIISVLGWRLRSAASFPAQANSSNAKCGFPRETRAAELSNGLLRVF